MLRTLSCAFLLLVASAPSAEAATFRVDSTADVVDATPGDGVCASAGGSCTLRAAVQEANALPGPDRIRVPAGAYVLTRGGALEDGAVTGDLDLHGRVRVVGAGVGETVIDGSGLDRVFDVQPNARVTLAKLAVRGGDAGGSDLGGGIDAQFGTRLILKRLLVEGNEAFIGGGVASIGVLKVLATTIRQNVASVGGGLAVSAGSTIRSSTFNDNTATGVGAFTGEDILAQGPGTVTIVNSTITGQIETIAFCMPLSPPPCNEGADVVLANVTVNAVSRVSLGPDSGSFTLRNTIVEQCDAELISQGYNFVAPEGCVILGNLNGVVVGDTPLLGSLKDNGGPTFTRLPVAVSEAVDNGHPSPPGSGGNACEPTDQRGVERPRGLGCDIGAVEGH
jgi:CSLREA domain-containing protein